MDEIFNYDCEILDIQDYEGATGYIDFIDQEDVKGDVMKGTDKHGRNFLVFKSKFIYSDKEEECFSTFFKRYIDIPVYHICGHGGNLMMETVGGMTLEQTDFLKKLLYEKVVDIDFDMIIDLKLNCYPFFKLRDVDKTKLPYQVKLGH
jgi:hypothetical protein